MITFAMGIVVNFEELATKYELEAEFVEALYDKVVDKGDIERALRMFKNGTLKYEVAIGKEPIDVAKLRKELSANFRAMRSRIKAQVERERLIAEYYGSCQTLMYVAKPTKNVKEAVFVKDGHVVAFAHYEPKGGGIYAANNEVMPNFRWTPHEYLARLRKINKAFYRAVKKSAFADDKKIFNFNVS